MEIVINNMATFVNRNRASTTMTNRAFGKSSITWEEATFAWNSNEAQSRTWESGEERFETRTKNATTFTNRTKN